MATWTAAATVPTTVEANAAPLVGVALDGAVVVAALVVSTGLETTVSSHGMRNL